MEYVARKLNKSRWEKTPANPGSGCQAEAMRCIATQENALSFWMCDATRDDVAAVALALAVTREHLDKIEVVLLKRTDLEGVGLQCRESPGQTMIQDLTGRHINIEKLDISGLCNLGRMISEAVDAGNVEVFNRPQIIAMLSKALEDGRCELDQLKPGVQKRLERPW